MHTHPPTWRNFRLQIARDISDRNDCLISEAMACTPFYRREWEQWCEDYAAAGGKFRAGWLNTLNRTHRFMLAKHYRDSIPRHYVLPENRHIVEAAP